MRVAMALALAAKHGWMVPARPRGALPRLPPPLRASSLRSNVSVNSDDGGDAPDASSASQSGLSAASELPNDVGLASSNAPDMSAISIRKKKRLDELCVERYPHFSRTLIQSWILQGKVYVNGVPIFKSGTQIAWKSNIEIKAEIPKFVCRAGFKLEKALQHFDVNVRDAVVLDAGLSTGGFSDCLLQNGAALIYGVDVGYGQVAEKIRTDPRMVVLERTNLRHLKQLPQLVDLVTLDLSFISILLVMPAVVSVMKPKASLITLIKPQFEAKRGQVGHGGIVRDPNVHKEVVERVVEGIVGFGFECHGHIPSPITGTDGNVEFLSFFTRQTLTPD